ncbi:hypothetical protein BH09BAC2_BH09BAC2_16380 [soil metagenome]
MKPTFAQLFLTFIMTVILSINGFSQQPGSSAPTVGDPVPFSTNVAPDPNAPPPPPDPIDTPFDGGILLLAATAVGYGVKKKFGISKEK